MLEDWLFSDREIRIAVPKAVRTAIPKFNLWIVPLSRVELSCLNRDLTAMERGLIPYEEEFTPHGEEFDPPRRDN